MDWVQMKGHGKLIAFTTVAVGTSPMVEEGYDRERHYCCGIVELEEGPRISAQILGLDCQNPDDIEIGTPVSVEFLERDGKPAIVAFRVV
jgi:uncharacterized OB-fold protein